MVSEVSEMTEVPEIGTVGTQKWLKSENRNSDSPLLGINQKSSKFPQFLPS